MATLDKKTSVPQPSGNPNQSPIPLGQAAGGGEAADVNGANSPGESDDQLAKAWGFSMKRPRRSRQVTIGLVAIVALLGSFAFVVIKKWKNLGQVVAQKTDDADSDRDKKQNSDDDPFVDDALVTKTQFEAPAKDTTKRKPLAKGLDLDDEFALNEPPRPRGKNLSDDSLDITDGQSEPPPMKTAAQTSVAAQNSDDDFNPFDDVPKAVSAPSVSARNQANDEFEPEVATAKPNSPASSRTLDVEDQPAATIDEKAMALENETDLTQPSEPIRLKQPIEEQFEESVRVAQQPRDDLGTAPLRTRRPATPPREDAFAESVPAGFDNADQSTTRPTTDLLPARAKKAHPSLREGEYIVELGDNFCIISKKLYGSEKFYLALAEHNRNRVADPCRMRPGLIISAPPLETLERQHAALIAKPKKATEAKKDKPHAVKKVSNESQSPGLFHDENGAAWYRVGKDDTLSEIAQAHLGRKSRSEQIYQLNRERLPNPGNLDVGQVLRLPNDATRLRLVEAEPDIR